MELHLKIIGYFLTGLSLLHIGFPKYFNWQKELSSLSLVNRQMMQVHAFFIAFVLLLMGLLCITSAKEITETALGKKISLGLGIFWTTRLITQFFIYSTELWKGKKFETFIHVFFSLLWAYFGLVFLIIFFSSK